MNSIKLPCGIEWVSGQQLGKSGLFLILDCDGKAETIQLAAIRYQSGGVFETRKTVFFRLRDIDAVVADIEGWLIETKGVGFLASLDGYRAAKPDTMDDLKTAIEAAQKAIAALSAAIDAVRGDK